MNESRRSHAEKVLYVDPSLRSNLGHHANVCGAIVSALREHGHPVETLISAKAKRHLEGDRVLRKDVYRHMSLDPHDATDRRRLRADVASFCSEMIPRLAKFRPNLVYAHSVGAVACEGILRAIATVYEADHAPTLIAELPFPCEPKEGYYYGAQLKEMFSRIASDAPQLLQGFLPVTVNSVTSSLLSSTVEYDVATMPSPYAITRRRQPLSDDPARPVRIGSVGHQSDVKGFQLLPEILRHVSDSQRPIEFVVQIQADSDAGTVDKLRAARAAGLPIQLIEEDLDRARYESLLHDLDIMLLPYQPSRYISAISGVCYEALALGSIVVAPASTTIGGLLREFQPAAPLFSEWTAASVAATLRQAITDFGPLQAEARAGVEAYYRSNGPSRYAGALIAQASVAPVLSLMGRTPLAAKTFWTARSLLRCG